MKTKLLSYGGIKGVLVPGCSGNSLYIADMKEHSKEMLDTFYHALKRDRPRIHARGFIVKNLGDISLPENVSMGDLVCDPVKREDFFETYRESMLESVA